MIQTTDSVRQILNGHPGLNQIPKPNCVRCSTFRIGYCKEINKLTSTVGRLFVLVKATFNVPQGENERCRNRKQRNQPHLLSGLIY